MSAVTIWYPEARKALQRLNAENPDPISSALLLLPENPDGLTYLVERAPVVLSRATEVVNSVGGEFSSSSEVGGRGRSWVLRVFVAAMWYLRDALLVGMVAFAKLFLAGVVAAVVAGASPLNAVRALKRPGEGGLIFLPQKAAAAVWARMFKGVSILYSVPNVASMAFLGAP